MHFVCMGMGVCMPWCMCDGQRRTASAARALDQVVRPGGQSLYQVCSLFPAISMEMAYLFLHLCLGFGRTMKKSTMKLQEQLELSF